MRQTILLPASVGLAVFLACVVALLAALASAPVASAASGDTGASFAIFCDFSHRATDDPIVHPNDSGASHRHDFFGNRSTNADPTYERMLGQETTCTRDEDTAAYWFPTVSWKDQNGTSVRTPNRTIFYYRAGGKDYRTVQPFAKDLKVIDRSRIRWYCGVDDDKAGSADPPTYSRMPLRPLLCAMLCCTSNPSRSLMWSLAEAAISSAQTAALEGW